MSYCVLRKSPARSGEFRSSVVFVNSVSCWPGLPNGKNLVSQYVGH